MSEQNNVSTLKPTRASKIQIEVKEIAPQMMSKKSTSQLSTDGDDKGEDLSNE